MEAKNKIEAVYELREAAEAHGRAEQMIELQRSPENLDRLIEAREVLEFKTMEAIRACEHCGEAHCDDPAHERMQSNVINVEFIKRDGEAGG